MATFAADDKINILLAGKTGTGKSSTANSIFGKRVFEALPSAASVTQKCQSEYTLWNGYSVKVVDLPGLADSEMENAEAVQHVITEIEKAVTITPEGYDAIFIVTTFGRVTKEDMQTVTYLKGILGEHFIKDYGILLLTHGSDFLDEDVGMTFEQWCADQKGAFASLFQECCGRVLLFDNKTKDDELMKCQLKNLFSGVDHLRYGPKRYTPAVFQSAQNERNKLVCETKAPKIQEDTVRQTKMLMDELDKVSLTDPVAGKGKLMELHHRAQELLNHVIDQDKGTGALSAALTTIETANQAIVGRSKMADTIIREKQKKQEMSEKMKNMEAGHKKEVEDLKKAVEEIKKRRDKVEEDYQKQRRELDENYHKMKEGHDNKFEKALSMLKLAGEVCSIVQTIAGTVVDTTHKGMKMHKLRKGSVD